MAAAQRHQGTAATAVGAMRRWQVCGFVAVAFAAVLPLLLQPRGAFDAPAPAPLPVVERHVAAAARHLCVIRPGKEGTGVAACYGNPTFTNKLDPPEGVAFHAVTAGDDFSCGLTAVNSSLVCWGALPGGTAQLPPASTFFVDVHAGPRHVCGLVPNGTIYCYGHASPRGATNVPRGVDFQAVSAGSDYTCGVARNHSVVCWGDATNPVVANTSLWRAITDAEHVAAGSDHACYIRVNGSVACWGSNSRGAAAPPSALAANGSAWWLAAGAGMTCAITGTSEPGPVTCWGAVSSNITHAGNEVACAGWGCVALPASATGSGAGNGSVVIAAAVGGLPLPQTIGDRGHGIVSTLAGNGEEGVADGVGAAARFSNPRGVSLDGLGGLYVVDAFNGLIRRVEIVSGIVATVTGTRNQWHGGRRLFHGVEADGAGNVYVADTLRNVIRMLSGAWVAGSTTGANGSTNAAAGTSATFHWPCSVRADVAGGLLYVADTKNNQVRTVAITGSHAVSTLATLPAHVLDIALNPAVRIMYVAVGSSVYVVTYAGVYTLLAGGVARGGYADGTGTAARFRVIYGLALDSGAEFVYATDCYNHGIRRITTAGGVVTTVAGLESSGLVDGVGTAAAFNYPWGIAVDAVSGALYVADSKNHAVRRIQIPLPVPVPVTATAPLPLGIDDQTARVVVVAAVLVTAVAVGACVFMRRRPAAAAGAVVAAAAGGVVAPTAAGGAVAVAAQPAVVAGTLEARAATPGEVATTMSDNAVPPPAEYTLDGAHATPAIADRVAGSPVNIMDAVYAASNAPEVST